MKIGEIELKFDISILCITYVNLGQISIVGFSKQKTGSDLMLSTVVTMALFQ